MSKLYRGIDISLYQKKPNFAALAADGIDFVMMKASQGRTEDHDAPFADPFFEENVTSFAQTPGHIYAGAYHYFCARNMEEAEAEADFFIRLVSKYRYNLQLWAAVDVEDDAFLPKDRTLLTAMVERFCEKVKTARLRPMVYANSYWLNERFDLPEGVPVWEANWSAFAIPDRARMWQYSARGSVSGVEGEVDMNLARHIIGDANGDGEVNVKDVFAILRRIAGWKNTIDESQADLDRDGYVTMKDVTRLLREIVAE